MTYVPLFLVKLASGVAGTVWKLLYAVTVYISSVVGDSCHDSFLWGEWVSGVDRKSEGKGWTRGKRGGGVRGSGIQSALALVTLDMRMMLMLTTVLMKSMVITIKDNTHSNVNDILICEIINIDEKMNIWCWFDNGYESGDVEVLWCW